MSSVQSRETPAEARGRVVRSARPEQPEGGTVGARLRRPVHHVDRVVVIGAIGGFRRRSSSDRGSGTVSRRPWCSGDRSRCRSRCCSRLSFALLFALSFALLLPLAFGLLALLGLLLAVRPLAFPVFVWSLVLGPPPGGGRLAWACGGNAWDVFGVSLIVGGAAAPAGGTSAARAWSRPSAAAEPAHLVESWGLQSSAVPRNLLARTGRTVVRRLVPRFRPLRSALASRRARARCPTGC